MPPSDLLLLGLYSLRLQAGARMTLPVEWREELADRKTLLVLKPTPRPFILLIPADALCEAAAKEIQHLGLRVHTRRIDTSGRIRLPRDLIEAVGLKTEFLARGVLSGIELWDPEADAAHTSTREERCAAAAEIGF